MNQLVIVNGWPMSVENYLIYTCAWCCIQPQYSSQEGALSLSEHAIAVRGGIVFW